MPSTNRITVLDFLRSKQREERLCVLTAYDFPTARLVDEAGVDGILVGDSLAMVVQGRETTLPVTLDQMIYHAEMVGRAARRALVVVDLPFPVYHLGPERSVEAAGRVLKETTCHAVKLEGGGDLAPTVRALVAAGIPVMGHVGLRPQSIHQLGGYRVQRNLEQLRTDALALQDAGAFSLVLECIPRDVAKELTACLSIPTIGIGAGPDCDGQVLVGHDMLGLTPGRLPRHVKTYADLASSLRDAVGRYCQEVREGHFPDDSQSFH